MLSINKEIDNEKEPWLSSIYIDAFKCIDVCEVK